MSLNAELLATTLVGLRQDEVESDYAPFAIRDQIRELINQNVATVVEMAEAFHNMLVMDRDGVDSPLRRWWVQDAMHTADATIAKMEEYGSGDLVALGQNLRRMANRPPFEDPVEAMELGCLMYNLGKIERAVEAIAADRPIKSDTWFDMEVYAKMARAARAKVWVIAASALR